MISIPTIETERLLLRSFREDDLDEFAVLNADPEVVKYLGAGKPWSREETWMQMASFLGHWELRGYGLWAVEERSSGKFIGRIGLLNPEGWYSLELAWTLTRSRWGNGFATEGARAALEYAFNVVKVNHIVSLIDSRNLASMRVAERVGEKLEERIELRGKNVSVYGIARA
jgi:RimJ/RimL family protein N-acetyltransferase